MSKDLNERQESNSIFTVVKSELVYLAIVLVMILFIFKIAFYKENLLTVIKTAIGVFWIFVLPAFFVLYYWREKFNFIERLIISFTLNSAVIGISSYYLGLVGVHIKYHHVILPPIFLIIGVILIIIKERHEKHI